MLCRYCGRHVSRPHGEEKKEGLCWECIGFLLYGFKEIDPENLLTPIGMINKHGDRQCRSDKLTTA